MLEAKALKLNFFMTVFQCPKWSCDVIITHYAPELSKTGPILGGIQYVMEMLKQVCMWEILLSSENATL